MAAFRVSGLLRFLSLVILASITTAAEPPRTCINTGITCIESCTDVPDGDYQWCGSCQHFIQCSQGTTYYQPCPANLYWHDDAKACVAVSDTCVECITDTSPVTPLQTTTPMVTVIPGLCNSTGLECIDHCDVTHNGVYQWCGRCDYFLLCSGSEEFFMECQPGLEYDHTVEACVYESTTCVECFDPFATTTKFDPCSSLPCLNDGTCISSGDSFTCVCPDKFTGSQCEAPTSPCNSFPCLNGGTCFDLGGNQFTCDCPPGWTGPRCESPFAACDSFPCLNGGTCFNQGSDSYTCTCPIGWTGPRCETPVPPCDYYPCINGGTCFNQGSDSYTCTCPIGWTGERCEIPTSPCDSLPCLNGGTCNDLGDGSFSCTCPLEWTGLLCESNNYYESWTCGTELEWADYPASNGFTRLCQFWRDMSDTVGRNTECRNTIKGIPLYNDHIGLMEAGGNFGCIVSQNYPDDLAATSYLSCADDYQQDVSLGNYTENDRLMVCIRYPYDGVPARK